MISCLKSPVPYEQQLIAAQGSTQTSSCWGGKLINPRTFSSFPQTPARHLLYERQCRRSGHSLTVSQELRTTKIMKLDYDLKTHTRQYQMGDVVYLLDTAVVKGQSRKLSPPWIGPGIIVQVLTSYLYQGKTAKDIKTVHHDRMKLCEDRELPPWIQRYRQRQNSHKPALEVSDSPPVSPNPAPGQTTLCYCICRQPDNGALMIQCDFCHEWYHGACVNLTAAEICRIDKYRCLPCKSLLCDDTNTSQ